MSQDNGLYIALNPPGGNDPATLSKWMNDYQLQFATLLEKKLLINTASPLRVPDTTIDVGSSIYTFASAATAYANFLRASLPNSAATTNSAFQTALNYTGKGILQCVFGVSQIVGGLSTAVGMSIQITIDGNILYTAASLAAVNTGVAVIGQIIVDDPTNDYLGVLNDPVGLSFNKTCKVEFKSGSNGQGVSIGWRVLKLH